MGKQTSLKVKLYIYIKKNNNREIFLLYVFWNFRDTTSLFDIRSLFIPINYVEESNQQKDNSGRIQIIEWAVNLTSQKDWCWSDCTWSVGAGCCRNRSHAFYSTCLSWSGCQGHRHAWLDFRHHTILFLKLK